MLGKILEDIKSLDKAIKLNPNYAPHYYNKGKIFNDLKKYLEAIECYDEAIKRNPFEADFYMNKGNAFYNLERYLEASECYTYLPRIAHKEHFLVGRLIAGLPNSLACHIFWLTKFQNGEPKNAP